MRNRLYGILGLLIIGIIIYIFIFNNYKKVAIKNVIDIYNQVGIKNINFNGTLKTEHTSNMVHTMNQVYEKDYNFKIDKNNDNIEIYLDNKRGIVKSYYKEFNIEDINSCKYVSRDKELISINTNDKRVNRYNYECNGKVFEIYTSEIFNKYIMSRLYVDDSYYEFRDNYLEYKNNVLDLKYTDIKKDNYILNGRYKDKKFEVYYTYNDYKKYSVIYEDNVNFNIIIKDNIIISINSDTKRYSKLQITMDKGNNVGVDNYQDVDVNSIFTDIMSLEIYDMFK